MSHLSAFGPSNLNKFSSKKTVKPVNFVCLAPEAQEVFITGDFNDWDPKALPMKKSHDGAWTIQVPMSHGHHHYLFLVDGKPVLDPKAQGIARNEKNEKVSMIAVS